MPPKRRRKFQGLYYHSSPPKVLPMNGQITNSNDRRRRNPDDFSVKLSTIRIWMHEKDIGKLTRVLWAGQGNRLRQQASTNPKVKRFLTAVPYVMNSIKDVHQAVIDNSLETLQSNLEPPVPPALVTCRDANGLNLIHKAAGLGHATILEYLISTWPDGVHETDITGKTPLHWAASAKNNMRCYTLLTQAGCDEEAVDYKMKTPSFYRHKPHEIERAFLTYVPEAPRVSPDVATDWEALSDESGDGRKLDIKIPEMNGFGRHSNAESNENTSEAEVASGQEDEDMSKDGDAADENSEAANENEPDNEEAAEEEPEAKDENDHTEEQPEEKKEEEKVEEETIETKGDKEDQEQDTQNESETKAKEESQDEKPQTRTLNETTENLTKDSEDDEQVESSTDKQQYESNENEHQTPQNEEVKEKENMEDQKEESKNESELDKDIGNIDDHKEESKNESEHVKDISTIDDHKDEKANEKNEKETTDEKTNEHDNKDSEDSKTFGEDLVDIKDEVKDQVEHKLDKKASEEDEKDTTDEKRNERDGKESDESKTIGETLVDIKDEVKDNVKYLANQIKNVFNAEDEHKSNGEKEHEKDNLKTDVNEKGAVEEETKEHDSEASAKSTVDEKSSEQENGKKSIENVDKTSENDNDKMSKEILEEKTKADNEKKESDTEKTGEQKTLNSELKTEQTVGENGKNNESVDEKALHEIGESNEMISDMNKDQVDAKTTEKTDKENEKEITDDKINEHDGKDSEDSKTIGEALVDIKDEVKDNVKYFANQIKNVFSDKDEGKNDDEKEKEKENLKIDDKKESNDKNETKETEERKEKSKEDEKKLEDKSESINEKLMEDEEKPKSKENGNGKENGENLKENDDKEKLENISKADETTKESVEQSTSSTSEIENTTKENSTKSNENAQSETETNTIDPMDSSENFNTSNVNSIFQKQTPHPAARKTPPKESTRKENDKTEEDENNNTNKLNNETVENAKATTSKETEATTKTTTFETITDDQFKELNKSLEEYTKVEEEALEEKEKHIGDKLEEITDNLKENVKELTDKVINVFSSSSSNKDKANSLETETNDVVVHATSPEKQASLKKVVKDGESSDETADEDEETHIQSIIASGDMEELAQIVLNGDGQKLLNVEATEPEIQAFLKNVPNYMNKIRRVHEAARNGSLLNLQQALDRRKFAIAKDEISPNGATPLHVAVLFGNSDIVRYLSARFPETTTIMDNDGRTALHYAAVINDNGHFYNVLLQLGANPKVVDKMGHTPEDYLSKEELKDTLNYQQLLKRFGAEDLEEQLLNDQGQIENPNSQENPIFKTEQGKYLADNLADPLIKALTQVAQKRPNDPLQYLTNYLQSYVSTRNTNGRTVTQAAVHSGSSQTNSTILASSKTSTSPPLQRQSAARMNGHIKYTNSIEDEGMQQIEEFNNDDNNEDDGNDSEAEMSKKLEERDEHGQSMLHFACARSHRKGGLIHLIEESKSDITYRDELYRTARDVALQANQLGNAKEIDRYVMSLAIVGDIKPFEHLAISGYDHIIDVLDDNETPIIDVVEARGLHELAKYLKTIRPLEELREELHQMIRDNKVERVKEIADSPDGKWLIKAKNYYGRTALHIAILKESVEIVEHFVNRCPEALKIGDNLERTALHYAMGTNIIESISRILIQNGAKRTYKDLKGRQPSYYFMNKADILRLQEEEDENR